MQSCEVEGPVHNAPLVPFVPDSRRPVDSLLRLPEFGSYAAPQR